MNKIKYNFDDFVAFLICLIPPLMILGPALPDLIISIAGISFLVKITSQREFTYLNDNLFKVSFLMWFYFLLTTIFNQSLENTFNFSYIKEFNFRIIFYFRFILFYLAFVYFFNKSKFSFNLFFKIIIITYSFVVLDTFFQYFKGEDIFGFTPTERGMGTSTRLSGPFNDELIPGSYLYRFLFIFILGLIYFFKDKKYINFILTFSIILSVLIIFLTGERSAFILSVFGLFILFILNKNYRNVLSISSLTVLILIVVALVLNPVLKKRMIDYTLFQMGISDKWAGSDKSYLELLGKSKAKFIDSPHGAHYEVAYEIWKDNKFFGIGLKKFRVVCDNKKYENLTSALKKQRCSTHPHNTYLEVISETGIVGLFFFLLFIFTIFKKYFFHINIKEDIFILLLILTIFLRLWPIIPTGSFFTNSSSIHFWFTLGLLNYFYQYKRNKK